MTATRTRAALPTLLALLGTVGTLGAATGCRRSQPDAVPPAAAPPVREAGAAASPDPTPDGGSPRPNVAAPEAPRAETPKRPAGVPAEAFWVGGPDGGVFVLLERAKDRRGPFAAKIHHPDGEVWYAGPLVPAPRGAAIDPARHDQFAGWDGERLLLSDGRWLEPVKTKRAHGR